MIQLLIGPAVSKLVVLVINLALNVPALNDPALNDPALNDPALNDPALNDPALNGPALNGPALNGPAYFKIEPTFKIDIFFKIGPAVE